MCNPQIISSLSDGRPVAQNFNQRFNDAYGDIASTRRMTGASPAAEKAAADNLAYAFSVPQPPTGRY